MAYLMLAKSLFSLPTASLDAHMDCGPVSLCGIMTLETGQGPGMRPQPADATQHRHSPDDAKRHATST